PLGEVRVRERCNMYDRDPFLRQTVELSADRVELSGRRYEAGASPQGQRREPAHDQLVRIHAQRDGAVRVVEQLREAAPHAVRHGESVLPLVVYVLRRVEPGALLGLETDVRPGLMRVAGQEQPLGDAEPAVVTRE